MNILLKVVKIGLTGSAIYCGAKICTGFGYIAGYGDATEVIFDAAGLPEDEPRRNILRTHAKVAECVKEIKSNIKEIKTTLKK